MGRHKRQTKSSSAAKIHRLFCSRLETTPLLQALLSLTCPNTRHPNAWLGFTSSSTSPSTSISTRCFHIQSFSPSVFGYIDSATDTPLTAYLATVLTSHDRFLHLHQHCPPWSELYSSRTFWFSLTSPRSRSASAGNLRELHSIRKP